MRCLVANHIKNKAKTRIFAYFAGFFSCQKGHFDGGCAIKESLEGSYKRSAGAAGGVRQGATQGAMGYTPGGGEANGKGKRNGWAVQKARWAGDFGGSGEGMYYGVSGLVAWCKQSKPPPAR